MKKFIFIILFVFIAFSKDVSANDEKLKVIMFNATNTTSEQEALEEIKSIDGYNKTFELVILNTVEVNANEDGTDKYNMDNYNLFKKTIEQYNVAYNTELVPKQYPTFLIGNKVQPGVEGLKKLIDENIKSEILNSPYNCLLSNSKYNCFNNEKIKPKKKDMVLFYSLSLIIVLTVLMWLSLKSEKKRKVSVKKYFNC